MVHSVHPGASTPGAAAPTFFNLVSAAHQLQPRGNGVAVPTGRAQDNYHQLCGHIDNIGNVADDLVNMANGIDLLLSALECSAQALSMEPLHTLALRGLLSPISHRLQAHACTLGAAVADPVAR